MLPPDCGRLLRRQPQDIHTQSSQLMNLEAAWTLGLSCMASTWRLELGSPKRPPHARSDIWAGKIQTTGAGGVGAPQAPTSCGLCIWQSQGRWTSYRVADSSWSKLPRKNLGEAIWPFLTSLRSHRVPLTQHSVHRGAPCRTTPDPLTSRFKARGIDSTS